MGNCIIKLIEKSALRVSHQHGMYSIVLKKSLESNAVMKSSAGNGSGTGIIRKQNVYVSPRRVNASLSLCHLFAESSSRAAAIPDQQKINRQRFW